MKKYIGIDIGGTFIKHALLLPNGNIFYSDKCMTEASRGGRTVEEKALRIVEAYLAEGEVEGVCISTAGVVDVETGEILHASDLIPEYQGINLKKRIMEQYHIPCEVENDVNCMGLAESVFGAGKKSRMNLCLTVGTGIGGAFVVDRQVFRGFSGSACEVGYMKMPGGEFQELASTRALCEKVAARKQESCSIWSGSRIFQAISEGDGICIDAVEEQIDVLAQGIANLCYILNPRMVILGGGIMEQEAYIKPRLEAGIHKYLPSYFRRHMFVSMAVCRNHAGFTGALIHFYYRQGIKMEGLL